MNTKKDMLLSERKDLIRSVAMSALAASILFLAAAVTAHYAVTPIESAHVYLLLTGAGFTAGVWATCAVDLYRIQKRITELQ